MASDFSNGSEAMDRINWWQELLAKVQAKEEPPAKTARQKSAQSPATLLPTGRLSTSEQFMDERIRTLCLVICATAVVASAAYFLQNILIPFVLALALKYLLTPTIDLLSCTSCNMADHIGAKRPYIPNARDISSCNDEHSDAMRVSAVESKREYDSR